MASGKSPAGSLPPAWRRDELSLDDPGLRRDVHWLLFAIAACFAAAVLWAAFAVIDEVTRGEGKVITSSQTQYIQNLEGGIIGQILVREGQVVEKGDVLFRIDSTRFASEFREGRSSDRALRAKVARLSAEAQRTRLQMPEDLRKEAPAAAQNELAVYEARQQDLANRNGIFREQLAQRNQELVEMGSRAARLDEGLQYLQKEIALTAPLVKQGIMSEVELLRLQREASRLRTDLDAARLALPRIQAAIEEAKRKMADTELAFRSAAAAELADAKAQLSKLGETLPALEDRVSRTEVRAPAKGIVKVIPNKTPGGVVQPGSPLAELVPLEDSLLVEAKIKPSDIAFVSVGQAAVVKLAAYDYSIYGGLEGKVEYVSGDSIQPQQGEPYFVAHVRTHANAVAFQGKLLPVIPGMTATADVLTGRKSVLEYLLKPINKVRERALRER
jgi:membrane fusion protein, adhesin transport system